MQDAYLTDLRNRVFAVFDGHGSKFLRPVCLNNRISTSRLFE